MVVEDLVYFQDISEDLIRLLGEFHFSKNALNFPDVQQIAPIGVSVEIGHHGFSLEGVELVQPLIEQLGLPDEEGHSYLADQLLMLALKDEGETVQTLSVQDKIVT